MDQVQQTHVLGLLMEWYSFTRNDHTEGMLTPLHCLVRYNYGNTWELKISTLILSTVDALT